jgi:hypothetical protein
MLSRSSREQQRAQAGSWVYIYGYKSERGASVASAIERGMQQKPQYYYYLLYYYAFLNLLTPTPPLPTAFLFFYFFAYFSPFGDFSSNNNILSNIWLLPKHSPFLFNLKNYHVSNPLVQSK